MGCDGGTIPKRDELVKVKKKPETKDKEADLSFQWQHCTISQERLQKPVVACRLGRLYNKDAVIEGLLDRSRLPECSKHIKTLKDVKTLDLHPNPEFNPDENSTEGNVKRRAVPFICPISSLEMSGNFRFVAIWTCGCVFSERVHKEVGGANCLKCQKSFVKEDVIVLNGTPEDVERMRKNWESSPTAVKKAKKEKNGEKAAKRTAVSVDPVPSTASKKAKDNYTVAADPAATDVYKSLFTSHKTEQEQGRAHWITYNPFYN